MILAMQEPDIVFNQIAENVFLRNGFRWVDIRVHKKQTLNIKPFKNTCATN